MNYQDINAKTIDRWIDEGWEWGKPVGSAGITARGQKYKVRHRAIFGVSVCKDFWGLGIGRALTEACIECAKTAGYQQKMVWRTL